MGRYYAMDRDNKMGSCGAGIQGSDQGEGIPADCPICAVENSYKEEVYDEFVKPRRGCERWTPDRDHSGQGFCYLLQLPSGPCKRITRAFCADEFDGFAREKKLDLTYVCFTQYDATIPHTIIAFKEE